MSRGGEAGSRLRTVLVLVAAGVVVAVGIALLVVGALASSHASDTRDRVDARDRERRTIVARTLAADRDADAPIGRTEKVTSSMSDILEASDAVAEKSANTSDVLQRAVELANNGNLGAARGVYTGEAAESVQGLNAELAKAQAALAVAQQAVAELIGPTP